jgi:hypothetical protein
MTSARDSNNPYELVVGRLFEGLLSLLLKEWLHAEVAFADALAIADGQDFPFVRDLLRPQLGAARAQLGRAGEGIALIHQGMAGLADNGIRVAGTDHLTRLAEAQALDGKVGEALITIEDALHANPDELVFRPNSLMCRAELRLKVGQTELAEAGFREAIALAQKMQAKSWELRATTSLARLLRDTNRRDEAHSMLGEIYNWFTEGFDTADLKDAKALLDELNR